MQKFEIKAKKFRHHMIQAVEANMLGIFGKVFIFLQNFQPPLYFFSRGFKHIALIIKSSCDFFYTYLVDTIPPLRQFSIVQVSRWYKNGILEFFYIVLLDPQINNGFS